MTFAYKKHPTFGHVYGPTLKTPTGRVSWPSLVTPKDPPQFEGQPPGTPRHELTYLFDKKSGKVRNFLLRLEEVGKEMEVFFNSGRKGSKISLGDVCVDGDAFLAEDDSRAEKYPYYKGKFVLVARNAKRPTIYGMMDGEDEEGNPIIPELDPSAIVAGMECRGIITPIFTTHGMSYKLEGVQLVNDDGTRYGGGAPDLRSMLVGGDDDDYSSGITDDCEDEEVAAEEEAEVATAVKPKAAVNKVNINAALDKTARRRESHKSMLSKL